MDELIFEVVKVVIMVVALIIARYLVPWLKQKIGAEKVAEVSMWAKQSVLMAEQVYKDWKGQDKKTFVTEYLKKILTAKNISLTDEQLNILIEAAVKQMKMQENSGILIEATDKVTNQ